MIYYNNIHYRVNYSKLSIIIILLLCTFLWLTFSNVFATSFYPVRYANVCVHQGDTLWNIAAKYTSNNEDIREVITSIRQCNNLAANASIYPGQTLKVPTRSIP